MRTDYHVVYPIPRKHSHEKKSPDATLPLLELFQSKKYEIPGRQVDGSKYYTLCVVTMSRFTHTILI